MRTISRPKTMKEYFADNILQANPKEIGLFPQQIQRITVTKRHNASTEPVQNAEKRLHECVRVSLKLTNFKSIYYLALFGFQHQSSDVSY